MCSFLLCGGPKEELVKFGSERDAKLSSSSLSLSQVTFESLGIKRPD